MISIIGKAAMPVLAGLALAGCTAPMQPYPETLPYDWSYWNSGNYVARPAPTYSWRPPVSAPAPAPSSPFSVIPNAEAVPLTPLRPVDPPESHPVDPSCGWWRLCNFWGGSS